MRPRNDAVISSDLPRVTLASLVVQATPRIILTHKVRRADLAAAMARKRQRTWEAVVSTAVSPQKDTAVDADEEEKFRIWQLFVDEYHDMVVELPLEFQRSFSLVRELEDAQQGHSAQLRSSLLSYLSNVNVAATTTTTTTTNNARGETPATDDTSSAILGPSKQTRELLGTIAKSARAAVRAGEDKVNLCRALYENVDRQIQSLDTSLARYEDSLVLGLRENTLPSHEAPSLTRKEAPGRTTNRAARALEHPMSTTLKKGSGRAQASTSSAAAARLPAQFVDDWTAIDPNEPTYCLCDRVSFGEMIACENEECPREWFHLECVGLTQAPVGTWYCPDCAPLFDTKKSPKKQQQQQEKKRKR